MRMTLTGECAHGEKSVKRIPPPTTASTTTVGVKI